MAMLFNYSFNNITTAYLPGALANTVGAVTVGVGDGPQSINTIHTDGATSWALLPNVAIAINGNGMCVGAGFTITAFGGYATDLFQIGGTNVSNVVLLALSPDGSMQLGIAAHNASFFSSPSGTFTFGNRHEVELLISSFASSNSTTVYLDGVPVAGLTAVTLIDLTTLTDGNTIHSVLVGGGPASSPAGGPQSTPMVIDSTYVLDTTGDAPCNAALGPAISVPMIPNAPGNSSQWTPNGASLGWECISEIPPDGDTTYISDDTLNHLETCELSPPVGITGVYAVSVIADQRQDTAGGGRTTVLGLGNGSVEFFGSAWGLGTTYKMNTTAFSFNPFTDDPWTLGAMSTLQVAVQVAS